MMTNLDDVKDLLAKLVVHCHNMSDSDVRELFSDRLFFDLLDSIYNPQDISAFASVQDFLPKYKHRAASMSRIHNYARSKVFKALTKNQKDVFISAYPEQTLDEEAYFLIGEQPHEGTLGRFKNGQEEYGLINRDVRKDESVSVKDFKFVDAKEFSASNKLIQPELIKQLDEPLLKLKNLLDSRNNDESKYQELLRDYPWVLSAHHSEMTRHVKLDDRNIPDFTGVRVYNGDRDIFEIKPPFTSLFTNSGDFSVAFNAAWNQAERYVTFVTEEKSYLYHQKGLRFDNPKCYLVIGYKLTKEQNEELRRKQGNSRAIQVITYDDLLKWIQDTVSFIKRLKNLDGG